MLLAAPLLLGLARCASPDPAIYTLRAVNGGVLGGGPVAIKIARPGLAGYLDRPEIVRDSSVSRLALSGGERWGEPLGDMVGRVLALDLAQRLPGSSVFTEAGTISVDPSATVELDIQRFDLDTSGAVVLLVQTAVEQGRSHDPSFHPLPPADGPHTGYENARGRGSDERGVGTTGRRSGGHAPPNESDAAAGTRPRPTARPPEGEVSPPAVRPACSRCSPLRRRRTSGFYR